VITGDPSPQPELSALLEAMNNGGTLSRVEAETVRKYYDAQLKRLEFDIRSRRVVSVGDVGKAVGEEYSRLRSRLLALPSERSPALFRCRTAAQVEKLLARVIEEALPALSY
jgi:hypothetical protein